VAADFLPLLRICYVFGQVSWSYRSDRDFSPHCKVRNRMSQDGLSELKSSKYHIASHILPIPSVKHRKGISGSEPQYRIPYAESMSKTHLTSVIFSRHPYQLLVLKTLQGYQTFNHFSSDSLQYSSLRSSRQEDASTTSTSEIAVRIPCNIS
jgi:hypothetical protein